jgi:hypothetical protein
MRGGLRGKPETLDLLLLLGMVGPAFATSVQSLKKNKTSQLVSIRKICCAVPALAELPTL